MEADSGPAGASGTNGTPGSATGASIAAVLSRGKVVYATGSATVSRKHTKLLLTLHHSIVMGSYTLTLTRGRKRQQETITIERV